MDQSKEEKTLLTFPCEFVIKAFGKKNDEFELAVISTIKKHCALRENSLQYRPSKDNKYLAISVTIQVENKQQLDTLYQELSTNPAILMVL